MNFHSHAFTSTAPAWYRVVVALWYLAGAGMIGFFVAGLLAGHLQSPTIRRICGWGWGVSTLLFLVPMVVNSCTYDPRL